VPDPARAAPAPKQGRRALVVEDSIVGRIFLQRLLEAAGYSVESATSSSELRHALGAHRWDLLFVDVSLPDSLRGEHLSGLSPATTVALVRDARDESAATSAGIRHALRKPFERGDLVRLLENLRLGKEAS
jgi:CheY-like chemotaxis protein